MLVKTVIYLSVQFESLNGNLYYNCSTKFDRNEAHTFARAEAVNNMEWMACENDSEGRSRKSLHISRYMGNTRLYVLYIDRGNQYKLYIYKFAIIHENEVKENSIWKRRNFSAEF